MFSNDLIKTKDIEVGLKFFQFIQLSSGAIINKMEIIEIKNKIIKYKYIDGNYEVLIPYHYFTILCKENDPKKRFYKSKERLIEDLNKDGVHL